LRRHQEMVLFSFLYVYMPGGQKCRRGGGEGCLSQSVFEHGIISGGTHTLLFPQAKLPLIVSLLTCLLCILKKNICETASFVFGQNIYIWSQPRKRHFCGILNISHILRRGRNPESVSKISESGFRK